MARKIFSCFISLLLCLFVAMPAYAQYGNAGQDRSKLPVAHKKKKEKDPNIPVYPLLNGLEVGVDLWGPGNALFGSDNFSAEAMAALNMKNRFFPTVEIGYGKSDSWNEEGIHYKTGAPYFRFGMDYNAFYKKKYLHKLLVGLRYGISSLKYDVASLGIDDPVFGGHFNPNIVDGVWGESIPFNHPGSYAVASGRIYGASYTWAGAYVSRSAFRHPVAHMATRPMYPALARLAPIRLALPIPLYINYLYLTKTKNHEWI